LFNVNFDTIDIGCVLFQNPTNLDRSGSV